jgi:hypothetical protein
MNKTFVTVHEITIGWIHVWDKGTRNEDAKYPK